MSDDMSQYNETYPARKSEIIVIFINHMYLPSGYFYEIYVWHVCTVHSGFFIMFFLSGNIALYGFHRQRKDALYDRRTYYH